MSGPSRRERLRPAELVGLSAVVAVFVGVIVVVATREPEASLIFAGVAFILALLLLAMLALVERSTPERSPDRPVLLPPDEEDRHSDPS